MRWEKDFQTRLIDALEKIAGGDGSSPSGLEGVAMALAGEGLLAPVGERIESLSSAIFENLESAAYSLEKISDSLEVIAEALKAKNGD
jgi:hypothetical protein